MTPEEAVVLVAYVKELCPSQKIGEYTPDAWYDVLKRWPLEDCRAAVAEILGRGNRWVDVGDIAAEVRRVRGLRLANADLATQPPRPVDAGTYRNGLRLIVNRLAAGDDQAQDRRALGAAPVDPTALEDTSDYRALREAWDAEQKAKRAAEKAERDARLTEMEVVRAAQREVTYAYGLLLTLTPDAQAAAYRKARAELDAEADTDELTIRAARLADLTQTAATPDAGILRDSLAKRGCPNGCEIGTHEKPCRYATADDRDSTKAAP